jgi:hypothetical protein
MGPIPSCSFVGCVASSSINSGIIGSSDLATIVADEITISRYGGEAGAESDAVDPPNEDEEDDVVDATPSIEQYSTRHHLAHV